MTHVANDLQSRHARHVHVSKQQVNWLASQDFQCFVTVACQQRVEATRRKRTSKRFSKRAVVVSNEHCGISFAVNLPSKVIRVS